MYYTLSVCAVHQNERETQRQRDNILSLFEKAAPVLSASYSQKLNHKSTHHFLYCVIIVLFDL